MKIIVWHRELSREILAVSKVMRSWTQLSNIRHFFLFYIEKKNRIMKLFLHLKFSNCFLKK